jgi:hypothetical protein
MTANEKLRQIRDKKRKQYEATRRMMMGMANVGVGGRPSSYFHDRGAFGPSSAFRVPEPEREGEITVRRGVMPQPTQIQAAADKMYGRGNASDMAEAKAMLSAPAASGAVASAGGGGSPGGFGGPGGVGGMPPELQAYLADVSKQDKAAFRDTQRRINELRMGHADKRQRVLDRVENFGHAQRALNQEKQEESLKNQRAFLAMKGLSNSNDLPAWQARSDRDWGLVGQKLNEDVDDRAIRYDISTTDDYLGAVERINNHPPNMQAAMEMAMKYGYSGDGQGYGAVDGQLGKAAAPAPAVAPQRSIPAMGAQGAMALARGLTGQMQQRPMYGQPIGPVVDESQDTPTRSKRIGADGMTAVQRRVARERLRRASKPSNEPGTAQRRLNLSRKVKDIKNSRSFPLVPAIGAIATNIQNGGIARLANGIDSRLSSAGYSLGRDPFQGGNGDALAAGLMSAPASKLYDALKYGY